MARTRKPATPTVARLGGRVANTTTTPTQVTTKQVVYKIPSGRSNPSCPEKSVQVTASLPLKVTLKGDVYKIELNKDELKKVIEGYEALDLSNVNITLKTVNGDVTFNGAVTHKGLVTVGDITSTGLATLNEAVVDGNSTFNALATFKNGAVFEKGFDAKGESTIEKLAVSDKATIKEAEVTESLSAKSATVKEGLTTKELTVNETATIKDLTTNGDATLKNIAVNEGATFKGIADFKEQVNVEKNLDVKETATIKNTVVEEKATIKDLTVSWNAELNELSVEKETTLKGDVTASSNLTVKGKTYLKKDLEVDTKVKTVNLEATGTVSLGETTVNGTLTANNNTVLKGNTTTEGLTVKQGAMFESSVGVRDNVSIDRNLSVGGTSTLSTVVANETATFNKIATFNDDATFNDKVRINNNLQATGHTDLNTVIAKGQATFESDVDIDKNLNIDGNTNVAGEHSVGGNLVVHKLTNLKDNTHIEKDLQVDGNVNFAGTSVFGGKATFNGWIDTDAGITAGGSSTINNLTTTGKTILSNVTFNWPVTIPEEALKDTFQAVSQKDKPNGYVGLGANGKINPNVLPDSIGWGMVYKGLYSATAGVYPATPNRWDYYIISNPWVIAGQQWNAWDAMIYNGTSWDRVVSSSEVQSVNGRKGAVTGLEEASNKINTINVDAPSEVKYPSEKAIADKVKELKQSIASNAPTIDKIVGLQNILDGKADKATTYTKTEVDTKISTLSGLAGDITGLQTEIAKKADKEYVDNQLATKADKATTYTKAEVDSRLATKANANHTHTVGEINWLENMIDNKVGEAKTELNQSITNLIDSPGLANKVNAITINKLNKTDIVDNLTDGGTDKVLSAEQGKVLKTLVDSKTSVVVNDTLTSDSITEALSAKQGKELKTALDTVSEKVNLIETVTKYFEVEFNGEKEKEVSNAFFKVNSVVDYTFLNGDTAGRILTYVEDGKVTVKSDENETGKFAIYVTSRA